MNEEKKYEYVLGVGDYHDFEILSRCLNPAPREIGVGRLFYVNEFGMGDGDGAPAYYDPNNFETIPESVYETAMKIFRETGHKMCALVKEVQPLDREIKEGDYLYKGGSFIFIEGISTLTGKCWIQSFYYDYYGLSIDNDTETFNNIEEWLNDFEYDDLSEFKVITKATYDRALNIAKSGVLEVKSYLKNSLTEK